MVNNIVPSSLPESAKKVQDHIRNLGFSCVVQELPGSTRTAQEAADTIGCSLGQIAKSLVFMDTQSQTAILVITSGMNMVDLKKLEAFGGFSLKKADAAFIKSHLGFAIGGVPPVAHLHKLRTFLDPDLQKYAVIWAAAGTPFSVFSLSCRDLAAMTAGVFLDLKIDD